jgi:hypothetical protein
MNSRSTVSLNVSKSLPVMVLLLPCLPRHAAADQLLAQVS